MIALFPAAAPPRLVPVGGGGGRSGGLDEHRPAVPYVRHEEPVVAQHERDRGGAAVVPRRGPLPRRGRRRDRRGRGRGGEGGVAAVAPPPGERRLCRGQGRRKRRGRPVAAAQRSREGRREPEVGVDAVAVAAVADLARAVAPSSSSLVENALDFGEDLFVPPRRLLRRLRIRGGFRLLVPGEQVGPVRREEARGERARGVARGELLARQDRAEELARDEGGGAVAAVAIEDAKGADCSFSRDRGVRLELEGRAGEEARRGK